MIYFHTHSMLSNATTIIDSITPYQNLVDKAKEFGCKAFGFSEHGNLLEWYHKKQYIEKAGMKYIHGVEMYITKTFDEKIRDNYHTVLMARNYEGFKELNKLVSKSFNRAETKVVDNQERSYYNPRISYEELKGTSDNILISSGCLGGILNSRNDEIREDFIQYMAKNKHRCFLEIQQHTVKEQGDYNRYLVDLHNQYDIPLIAGTDTHMVSEDEAIGRDLLQKRKGIHFDNEEGWNLALYHYDELVQMYRQQGAIDEKYYIQALNNTDVLYDLIESYDIDTSHKYPKISNNPLKDIQELCIKGLKSKNIEVTQEVKDRLNYELKTYEHNGAFDFILLEYEVKKWARDNDIFYGESRGSVSGSMIAYLLDITKVDSMKYDMNFERFMNTERKSLADIDTDWMPSRRDDVKKHLHENKSYYTAEIVTFNTIAEKGSIRDIGGALDIPIPTINDICNSLEDESAMSQYREDYPDLFKYAKLVQGTITSIGSHPAATICSPIDIVENVGTITLSTNKYPISTLNMDEIDSLNYVKLDVLGLDNVEIIHNTCKLAGIEPLKSDDMNFEDQDVWDNIMKSPVGIFQYEGDFAHSYLKQVFSDKTLAKMREFNSDIDYLYLMSVANGAIRPAGQSYRSAFANGELNDNGHKALNDFLKDTNGFLVFQEQIIEFLHIFCGYSMGEADIIRRGFSKKSGTNEYIPDIKAGFIKTMQKDYNMCTEESESLIDSFLQVIEDASDYLFSLNHSLPYSMIGYMCGWLRHYYPLEFMATVLEINAGNQDKTVAAYEYINEISDINVESAKFRHSKGSYTVDKDTNTIYKSISSIKNLNKNTADELYSIRNNKHNSLYDLLEDIFENTKVGKAQLIILSKLDFFSEFGGNQTVIDFIELFYEVYGGKQLSLKKIEKLNLDIDIVSKHSNLSDSGKTYMKIDPKAILIDTYKTMEDKKMILRDQVEAELNHLGYIEFTEPKASEDFYIVTDFRTFKNKNRPYVLLYQLKTGKTKKTKVTDARFYANNKFKLLDTIQVEKFDKQFKNVMVNNRWTKSDEVEEVLTSWNVF